jgi:6-phosphogluconolactonase (cycloisomerase 2 family)
VNTGSNNVSAYAVNTTTGALTAMAGSPFAAGANPSGIAFDYFGTEQVAYVVNTGSNNVSAYAVNTTTGALMAMAGSPFATGANPYSITLPIDSFNPWAY